jgi:hypothetical protein
MKKRQTEAGLDPGIPVMRLTLSMEARVLKTLWSPVRNDGTTVIGLSVK